VTRSLTGQGCGLRERETRVLVTRRTLILEDGRATRRRSKFSVFVALLVVLLGAFSLSVCASMANAGTGSAGGTSASASKSPAPQAVPPTVTTQPVSVDVTVGQTANFFVTATGTAPLGYQWRKNGTAISGATAASYTTPATTAADDRALFTVVVTNSAGSATSNAGTLLVHVAPYIGSSAQPVSQTVNVGQTATFSVTAMGMAPLSYQWRKNGTAVSGATAASYTTPATVSSDNGAQFTVVVTNSAGSATSNAATLTVNGSAVAPSITTQPANQTVNVGQTATFSVAATGTAPLGYQWQKNGTAISGATAASYTTPATISSDNGALFKVVVTNSAGNATSNAATLTVNGSAVAPSITTQPASQTVNLGQTATFSVAATGTAPLSYQWQKNGTAISGATSSSYTTPATVSSDNGAQFTVVVTNSAGSATSNAATLTVSSTGTTTAYGLTFPNAHPRLFWTPSRITTAQAWVASTGYAGLNTPYVRPLDDQDMAFTCYIMNVAGACAQVITDALAVAPTDANGIGAGDDNMRREGEWIMLALDWLAPGCGKAQCFTAGQVTTIVNNWNIWQANQDNVAQTWGNVGMPASNYFAGQFRNDFDFGIATYLNNTSADGNLSYGVNNRWPDLLNFASPTGTLRNGTHGYALHNQEGGGEYGRYSLNYYAMALASSALLGRDMWSETTAFESGVFQTIYNTMPTTTTSRSMLDMFTWSDDEDWAIGVNCGYQSHNGPDSHGGCGPSSQYYGDFMQAAANEFPSAAVGKLAREWIATVNPAIGPIHKSVDPGGSAQAYSTLPLDYYSSGAQYMYSRSDWTTNGTSMLWQMGITNGTNSGTTQSWGSGHGHWDAGTFQVFRKGVNIIRETAGYSEFVAGYNGVGTSDTFAGFAHNIPLVGGEAAINVQGCSDGPGVVKRLETQPNYSFAVTDLTLVYQNTVCQSGDHQERENLHVVSAVREYYYFRGINVLVILDRLQSDASTTSTTFVSHCETNPTVVSATIACIDGSQEAFYTALVPAAPAIAIVAENANGADAANWQYRIEANNSNPGNVVSYNIYTIQLGDASGFVRLVPSILDNGSSWTITLDANDSLIVNKGVTSSGGTIKAAGATNPLATTVKTMTITNSGPVWP
jgi:hypothetical protein